MRDYPEGSRMNTTPAAPPPFPQTRSWPIRPERAAVLALAVLVLAAYAGSLSGAPLLDDNRWMAEYAGLSFPPSWSMLRASSMGSRPLVAFTLAANLSLFPDSLAALHAVNIAIHLLASLALFGLVRRTALLADPQSGDRATLLALLAAGLWAAHPVQTQAVTYLTQRCESLMGLCYLVGMYCWARGCGSRRPLAWQALTLLCLGLGAMAKETIFTLPLAVMLYDFAFFRPGPGGWIKARGAAWGLFLALAVPGGMYVWQRIGGAVHDPGVLAPLHYAASQPRIIFEYLRLFLVPVGLCFDYAWPAAAPGEAWPWTAALALLLAASAWGLWKRHPLGLLGCLFFLLLAPVSSFIPIEDLMAEHRLYLPSACLAVAAGAGITALFGRLTGPDGRIRPVLLAAPALLILTLAGLTMSRNGDYRQGALHMWRDVTAKRPENRRANAMVGIMLVGQGKWEEAAPLLRQAVTGRGWIPKVAYALAGNAYGRAMAQLGRERQAFDDLMTVLVRDPGDEVALSNAGAVMVAAGQYPVAIQVLTPFLAAKPDSVMLRVNLARAMAGMGRTREALDLLREALVLYDRIGGELAQVLPGKYELLAEAGDALLALGQPDAARESYLKALSASPSPEGERHIVGQLAKLPPAGGAKP